MPKHHDTGRRIKTNAWLVIGVAVLVILLIIWLTVADFTGDTDVAAEVLNHFTSSSLAGRFS